jgi:DNA repair exonuclease SbcCD ATPase subunit
MKCYQCGQSHEHQRTDYPVGTTIVFQDAFAKQYKCPTGKVVGHCDDGLASVEFPTTGEIHTFHYVDYFKSVEIPVTRDVVEQLTAALADIQEYNAKLINDLAAMQKQVNALADKLQAGAYHDKDTALLLEQQAQRIADLETDRSAIAEMLNGFIEHSGHYRQAQRVEMLLDRYRVSQKNVINYAAERNAARQRIAELEKTLNTYREGAMQYSDTLDELHRRIAELEAAQDGRTYSEGCKP